MARYEADEEAYPTPPGGAAEASPETEKMSIGRYIVTRIPTLKPPMAKAPNPFKLLALLNTQQWLFFGVSEAQLVISSGANFYGRSHSVAGRGTHSTSL